MSADDTPHSTIHALLDDWGAPKTIHNPFTGTDDPMTVAGRLAEWRAALALAQVPAQRTCPDCGFTASRIGEFHITAQEARGVGPSSDHLALQAQEERPDIDVERPARCTAATVRSFRTVRSYRVRTSVKRARERRRAKGKDERRGPARAA